MTNKPNRRSIRLHGYDYSQQGLYYITICTQDRARLFGEVMNGEVVLNVVGTMIKQWLLELENKFKGIKITEFIIMPNHVHFILANNAVGVDLCVNPKNIYDNDNINNLGAHTGAPLHQIIRWFKPRRALSVHKKQT